MHFYSSVTRDPEEADYFDMAITAQSGTEERKGSKAEPLSVRTPTSNVAPAKKVDDSTPGISGTRWSSVLACVAGLACIAFRIWGDEINGQWQKDCEDRHGSDYEDSCKQYSGVLRVSCASAIVFILQTVASVCTVRAYDGLWIFKFLAFVGLSLLLLFTPVGLFDDDTYAYIGRICGLVFIVLQQLILLDFAYTFNETCVERSGILGATARAVGVTDIGRAFKSVWLLGLIAVGIICLGGFVSGMSVLYVYYGGDNCPDNNAIISISLVLVVVALLLQLRGERGSITTSAIVAIYVAYLTFSALTLNPDEACNATAKSNSKYLALVLGVVLAFVSIAWIAIITCKRIVAVVNSGGVASSSLWRILTGRATEKPKNGAIDYKKSLRSSIIYASAIYSLLSFYIGMVLTNWGTVTNNGNTENPQAGTTSMWFQAAGAWIAAGLYIVALLMPTCRICPRSVWDLMPSL
jgi:hypothetical protein